MGFRFGTIFSNLKLLFFVFTEMANRAWRWKWAIRHDGDALLLLSPRRLKVKGSHQWRREKKNQARPCLLPSAVLDWRTWNYSRQCVCACSVTRLHARATAKITASIRVLTTLYSNAKKKLFCFAFPLTRVTAGCIESRFLKDDAGRHDELANLLSTPPVISIIL